MIVDDVRRETVGDDTWELSARVRSGALAPEDRLRFRVTGAPAPGGPVDASPFVPALVLAAMRAGEPLELDATVSPRLLAAVPAAQRYYRSWDLGRIDETKVEAPAAEPAAGTGNASMCFTGGVDSWFSYVDWDGPAPIDTFVWISTPTRRMNAAAQEQRCAEVARLAATLGGRHVAAFTNLGSLVAPVVPRAGGFGPSLAAVGLTLGLPRHVIASSATPNSPRRRHSHPQLDPSWSTERTEIVHTGHESERIDKLAALAAAGIDWSAVHVCLESATNCSECEKCLRTMLGLHAAGMDPGLAFDRPLRPTAIARTRIWPGHRWPWVELDAALGRRTAPVDRRLRVAVQTALLRYDVDQARRRARSWIVAARDAARTR
jgi:hypothetical protein